jgi:hypothetical protein
MCKRPFGVQLLQNPPKCSSTKVSSYIRKFRVDQLQSHIDEQGISNMNIEEMRKYLVIYEEAVGLKSYMTLHLHFRTNYVTGLNKTYKTCS